MKNTVALLTSLVCPLLFSSCVIDDGYGYNSYPGGSYPGGYRSPYSSISPSLGRSYSPYGGYGGSYPRYRSYPRSYASSPYFYPSRSRHGGYYGHGHDHDHGSSSSRSHSDHSDHRSHSGSKKSSSKSSSSKKSSSSSKKSSSRSSSAANGRLETLRNRKKSTFTRGL